MLNSWQNRPKNVWHFSSSQQGLWVTIPPPSRGSGVTPVEAPPNWHQHWLRFSWMIQKCCGDTPDGSKARHCSLFEHAWDSVTQCFFHVVQDFPRKSKLEGSTFEYICRNLRAYHWWSLVAHSYHLYDLRWLDASLTHTALVAPSARFWARQFVALSVGGSWDGRCRVKAPRGRSPCLDVPGG